MATKGYPVKGIKSIVKVRTKKAPVKGAVFVEWDLLFKNAKAVTEKKDAVIKTLFDHIMSSVNPEATSKFTFEYQCFKCETNDLLYILRVYRAIAKPSSVETPPTSKTLKATEKSAPKAPAKAMAAMATADGPASSAIAFEGPLRPSGPPTETPPGLSSVVNAVDLPED